MLFTVHADWLFRVCLMSDRLRNSNGGGQEIMQSCTTDNVTNNNSNNISPNEEILFIFAK